MAAITDLAPHIPFLRRYARALTGSQQSGDAYVRAALEALASGALDVDAVDRPRLAAFKLLHALWSGPGAALDAGEAPDGGAVVSRLMKIAPIERQAFLLTALEGFSVRDIAAILRTDEDAVDDLLADAQAQIDAQLATDVLIIEDEPIIAADIATLVQELGHTICGVAATHTEAVEIVGSRKPKLILADIQLADGSSGIEAVQEILSDLAAPVIFITAFPERLLSGERPEPTYLISKPFEAANVKAAISQALFFYPQEAVA